MPDLNKSLDVLRAIVREGRLSKKAGSVKGTAKSLTTLEVIGLAVLIVSRQGLFHAQRTVDANRLQKPEANLEVDKQ
jgi:hypothetical protein